MFKENREEPLFEWGMIGDISRGRPNLGPDMTVSSYRLMQYTMRDVLIKEYGAEQADRLFHAAGRRAGEEFYRHVVGARDTLDALFDALQRSLREEKIGIFRVESADPAADAFVVTMGEDLDCSGIPVCSETICVYDEGFFAGVMHAYNGKEYRVKEVDCWGNGDRVCRFTIAAG